MRFSASAPRCASQCPVTDADFSARLDRVEAQLAIQQLAARYALAVDSKDPEAVAALFVPDVNAGAGWGSGRAALARFYREAALSGFYRSMHLIAGHVIELDAAADSASGVVHCRAEHEVGSRWGIMVMNYRDDYERIDGTWLFRRRRLQPLYSCDILERPQGPNFTRGWGPEPVADRADAPSTARIPEEYPTFSAYWAGFSVEHVARLTVAPVVSR